MPIFQGVLGFFRIFRSLCHTSIKLCITGADYSAKGIQTAHYLLVDELNLISQESQPSSPVETKVHTIEADELTLSSLSHEDTIEEAAPAPVENVPEDKPDKKPSVPSSNDGPIEEDKTEQMPPLGNIDSICHL